MSKLGSLTLKEKYDLILRFTESKQKMVVFAKENNIPRSTLAGILKKRSEILSGVLDSSTESMRKRQRKSAYEDIDEALLIWLKHSRAANTPITGLILQEKALEIAKEFDRNTKFTASNGWVQRFKDRNGLKFKHASSREKAAADDHVIEHWKKSMLLEILKLYSPQDIYNMDETGLFFQLLPDETKAFKNETCHGGTRSRQRITVLLCTNMTGKDKLKPLVIGNSRQPRCIKNVKSLPVFYDGNEKSWMTAEIWERIIRKFDAQFKKQKRSVVIVADNCPAHCKIDGLLATKIFYLPPNVTASVQPLDRGIIQSFKCHYRNSLMKRLLHAVEEGEEGAFNVTLLDAIYNVNNAWRNVPESLVRSCFQNAGFSQPEYSFELEDGGPDHDSSDDIPLVELIRKYQDYRRNAGFYVEDRNPYSVSREYCNVDINLQICCSMDVESIVSDIKSRCAATESDEESKECDEVPVKITKREALSAIMLLKSYLPTLENCSDDVFSALSCIENKVNT